MAKYAGHISRSLNHGLSSTSLENNLPMLRTRLNGCSVIGWGTFNACKGFSEYRTRSTNSNSAYIRPRASLPDAKSAGFPLWLNGTNPSDSGLSETKAFAFRNTGAASADVLPAATMHKSDGGACSSDA